MQFLDTLNDEQREAVLHTHGPLLILAGAGSGKTRVITSRIAYLVGDGHAQPDEVLAVTFTNKAAEEMRNRVETLLGADCSRMWVSTFHSLCARLLRREAPAIGLSRDFVIYDSSDQLTVVKQALKALQIDDSFIQPRAALSRISQAKNRMEGPDEVAGAAGWNRRDEQIAKVYARLPDGAQGEQRARLRRSAPEDRRALRAERAGPDEVLHAVPVRHGGRIPGHEPAAIPADSAAGRDPSQPVRRRRSGSVDLQMARRRPQEHPRFRARLSRSRDRQARTQLPLDADHPGRGFGRHPPEPEPQGQAALDRPGGRRPHRLLPRERRSRGGRFHHAHRPCRGQRRLRRHGRVADGRRPVSNQRPVANDRRRADARGARLQDHRRRPVLRAEGGQGRAGLHAAGHQPARRREPAARDQRAGARHRQGRDGGHREPSPPGDLSTPTSRCCASGLAPGLSANSLWSRIVRGLDERAFSGTGRRLVDRVSRPDRHAHRDRALRTACRSRSARCSIAAGTCRICATSGAKTPKAASRTSRSSCRPRASTRAASPSPRSAGSSIGCRSCPTRTRSRARAMRGSG